MEIETGVAFSEEFDHITEGEMTLSVTQKYGGDRVMLPFYYWDIFVNNDCVGRISLRIGRNFHSYYNGNVGYEIFPEYRGNGYAGRACRLVFPAARYHGMKELLLTCSEHNAASYRTIERLGAELVEIAEVPKEYFAWREGMERQRICRVKLG